ncbi:High-affinity branched-chain amino acid transport system permease protein LivH [archaeon HR01]|nr:High-affinity branched-chain amino acid transport system permease protein LivH [archaeon HR01]
MTNLDLFILDSVITAGYFAILALSLNIEYGYSGLIDFGKAAFFALGAYTSALLAINGYPAALAVAVAMLVSGLGGLAISVPAIRVRSDYLAIITLVFAESIRVVLKNESWLAGGVLGIRGIPPMIDLRNISYDIHLVGQAIFVLLLFTVFAVVGWLLTNSPFGRILRAIREDELASSVYGKNNTAVKAVVFSLASAMSGAAGSFYSQYVGFVSPDLFILAITLQIWIMSILGGPATILGGLAGAILFTSIGRGTRILKDYLNLPIDANNMMFILTGVLLVLVVTFRPTGLLKEGRIRSGGR